MSPLRGEGATCLVLRCSHSSYENEMKPLPSLLTTRTIQRWSRLSVLSEPKGRVVEGVLRF